MNSLEVAQAVVKAARYIPFGVYAILVILSRVVLSARDLRVATVMGGAAGLGMTGWLCRYFLEQSAPVPTYSISPTVGAVFSVALPEFVHDIASAAALVVAFGAVSLVLPRKE